MKTISDIISKLTEDEKDMHCEIIEECLAREADLAISRETILKNSRKLAVIAEKIVDDISRFDVLFTTISGLEKEMKQRCDMLRILSIPDDKFFHG